MARKILLETGYTFTASSRTIVIPRIIRRDRLALITNTTANQVIYNFSDPSLRATSYTTTPSGSSGTTTIVLNYNTTTMSNSDTLQIVIDEYDEKFSPSEVFTDPVSKLRVTQPQSLIDTDFEYGPQTTKWENVALVNNRPWAYEAQTILSNITAISMSAGSRTVTVSTVTPPAVGTPIFIRDTNLLFANGNFVVETVSAGTNFTYTARAANYTSITDLYDASKTIVSSGSLYSQAAIGAAPTLTVSGTDLKVSVTTTVPHGLMPGNEICVTGVTGTNPPNGNFYVSTVTSPTAFVYYANPSIGNPSGLTATSALIYVRPTSLFMHRPFDGGVLFGSNSASPNVASIRQTRRQFRYQSGKGLQISSGSLMRPYSTIDQLTSSGTTVTVRTREAHNIQPGATIIVSGAVETAYNGTFTVTSAPRYNTFTYTAGSTPSATPASGDPVVSVSTWSGAKTRLGAFDNQNGIFWEYDGTTLYAVRRSSTLQIGGRVSVNAGSSTVTQTNAEYPTSFAKQLRIGDWITLRGQSYKVINIASDTSMTINPPYRGSSNVTFGTITKMVETKVAQSAFNIDKLDGTGPSGYNINLGTMQMFYVDYSWYGAGTIRWGVRGTDGNIIYCHRLSNNNVNSEAYMRSGNLPARYETTTDTPVTFLTATLAQAATSMTVSSTAEFPNSGVLMVRNGSVSEGITYTGKTSTTFTGLTRGQAGSAVTGTATTWSSGSVSGTVTSASGIQIGQRVHSTANPNAVPDGTFVTAISGTTITLNEAVTSANPTLIFAPMGVTDTAFTYSATAPTSVELAYPTFSPSISHWGTAAIMDGRFDDDKSLVFTYGTTSGTTIAPGATAALFSIRVAPSVDNGQVGIFGAREVINRMQLKLQSLGITYSGSAQPLLVTAVLNGTPSTSTAWTNAVGGAVAQNSSLAQIASYAAGSTTVSNGEVAGGFFVQGTDRLDLTGVRDLGNSVLGGGGANSNANIYPDGPDTMTILVRNLGSSNATVFGRLGWTEAQA